MTTEASKILITGFPGVGKTTLVKKLAERFGDRRVVGFYTEEIRKGGSRQGFELVDFQGRRQWLSHVSIKSAARVGKYGVDIEGFEAFLDRLDLRGTDADLIIIDEIGKMECLSEKFRTILPGLLEARTPLAATIALKGGGFIDEIKGRAEVTLMEVTASNRDQLLAQLLMILK